MTEAQLKEARVDNAKLREVVAGNDRQRRGLEHELTETRDNLFLLRQAFHENYGRLDVVAKTLGKYVEHPSFPDETTVMGSLGTLITTLETVANDHVEQVTDGVPTGLKSRACHVLACLRLIHPEINLEEALTKGGADERRDDMMSEVEELGDSVIPFFEE